MGLADDVHASAPKRWDRRVVDAHLGPADAAELDALLADPGVVVQDIWRALRARGIQVSESAVQKWAARVR